MLSTTQIWPQSQPYRGPELALHCGRVFGWCCLLGTHRPGREAALWSLVALPLCGFAKAAWPRLSLSPQKPPLAAKLLAELPDEARVVAGRFPFPSWTPTSTLGQGLEKVWAYDMKEVRRAAQREARSDGSLVKPGIEGQQQQGSEPLQPLGSAQDSRERAARPGFFPGTSRVVVPPCLPRSGQF